MRKQGGFRDGVDGRSDTADPLQCRRGGGDSRGGGNSIMGALRPAR